MSKVRSFVVAKDKVGLCTTNSKHSTDTIDNAVYESDNTSELTDRLRISDDDDDQLQLTTVVVPDDVVDADNNNNNIWNIQKFHTERIVSNFVFGTATISDSAVDIYTTFDDRIKREQFLWEAVQLIVKKNGKYAKWLGEIVSRMLIDLKITGQDVINAIFPILLKATEDDDDGDSSLEYFYFTVVRDILGPVVGQGHTTLIGLLRRKAGSFLDDQHFTSFKRHVIKYLIDFHINDEDNDHCEKPYREVNPIWMMDFKDMWELENSSVGGGGGNGDNGEMENSCKSDESAAALTNYYNSETSAETVSSRTIYSDNRSSMKQTVRASFKTKSANNDLASKAECGVDEVCASQHPDRVQVIEKKTASISEITSKAPEQATAVAVSPAEITSVKFDVSSPVRDYDNNNLNVEEHSSKSIVKKQLFSDQAQSAVVAAAKPLETSTISKKVLLADIAAEVPSVKLDQLSMQSSNKEVLPMKMAISSVEPSVEFGAAEILPEIIPSDVVDTTVKEVTALLSSVGRSSKTAKLSSTSEQATHVDIPSVVVSEKIPLLEPILSAGIPFAKSAEEESFSIENISGILEQLSRTNNNPKQIAVQIYDSFNKNRLHAVFDGLFTGCRTQPTELRLSVGHVIVELDELFHDDEVVNVHDILVKTLCSLVTCEYSDDLSYWQSVADVLTPVIIRGTMEIKDLLSLPIDFRKTAQCTSLMSMLLKTIDRQCCVDLTKKLRGNSSAREFVSTKKPN